MSLHELCRVEGSAQEKRRKEKQGLPADRAVPSVDWGLASEVVFVCFSFAGPNNQNSVY